MAEYPVTRQPTRAPTHPGVLLRDEVLPALDISVSEAARRLRMTRQTLHRIMAGSQPVTPEMAVRLGKFCGNGPGLWLRLQQNLDLWHAQRNLRGELAKIPAPAKRRRAVVRQTRTA